MHNGDLKVRTLGYIEMRENSSSENIKCLFQKTLDKFGINIIQIVSSTTDNGGNMLKMNRLLKELQENTFETESELIDSDDDEENLESFMEIVDKAVLSSVGCAIHTVQLVVVYVLKEIKDDVIKQIRKNVCIYLTPSQDVPRLMIQSKVFTDIKIFISPYLKLIHL
jgi:hypothetical protein